MRARSGLALVAVLAVGVGAVALAAHPDDIDHADALGSDTHPLSVTVGGGFAALGYRYDGGWTVGATADGHAGVTGLRLTNDRGRESYVFVTLRLLRGPEVAASIACTGPGGRPVARSVTVTLDCSSADPLPASWDRVTVRDTY